MTPDPSSLPQTPHRRYNPLTDEWVLVSARRTERPWQGAQEDDGSQVLPRHDPDCYLCPGSTRASGEVNPQYDGTFVFTNDYAALRPDSPTESLGSGLFRAEPQAGTCRVVCFSPRHDVHLGDMARQDVRRVIDTWAEETEKLGASYQWVQIFENRGEMMGASNPHPHGQIWAGNALPIVPSREDASLRKHMDEHGSPLLADYVAAEMGGPREVAANDDWLVVVPFWAVWPFETLLMPRHPTPRLSGLDDDQKDGLTDMLQVLISIYDRLFECDFPYSMGWHGAPFSEELTDHWTVHAHFYPPLLRSAAVRKFMVGYELLAEAQRDITAEEAARRLRELTR